MNNCDKCPQQDNCPFDKGMQVGNCLVIENNTRLKELELAKPFLNSNYYWKRSRELKGEDISKRDTYSHNDTSYE